MKIVVLFLALGILLESTFFVLPVTLLIIIFSSVIFRNKEMFLLAFLSGIFLDIFSMRTMGVSSMYFVLLVFLIHLYERRFELDSLSFIMIASFLGSLGYLVIEGFSFPIVAAILGSLFTSFSYIAFRKRNKKVLKYA